jgi:sugar-phosphatase
LQTLRLLTWAPSYAGALPLPAGAAIFESERRVTKLLFPGRRFAAFLFDMDGTILSSIASAERVWAAWARDHGLDVAAFLPTIHGVQSVETVRRLGLPGVDPVAEAAAITRAEMDDVDDIDAIDGAAAFLASLPADRWAVVTSAPRLLAERRLAAAGLPLPPLFVTAEDVERGKPAPDCFLLAAERLGVDAADCLVFEDAAAGIAAAEAAGAEVVVITATHAHPVATAHARVRDYTTLKVESDAAGRLTLVGA